MKKVIFTGIICIVAVAIIHAQSGISNKTKLPPKVAKIDHEVLPQETKHKGKIIDAVRWTDDAGEHTLVTTETDKVAGKEDSRSAGLFAFHYLLKENKNTLTWKLNDGIKDCLVDVEATYITNTFAVTDLDKNGNAEVWLMYKTICHGDISPSNLKIIMYESDKKYAARGTSKVQFSEKDITGGEYVFDEAFKKSPVVFRQYADKLWKKNVLERPVQ